MFTAGPRPAHSESGRGLLPSKPNLGAEFGFRAESIGDQCTGVWFEVSSSTSAPPKVVRYDSARLFALRGPWRALCSMTLSATVLGDASVRSQLVYSSVLAIVAGAAGPRISAEVAAALVGLNGIVCGGLLFLLAPFVSTATGQWWALREQALNGLFDAVNGLSIHAACWFHSGTVADCAARALVKRLGTVSHALLCKQARDDQRLDDLAQPSRVPRHRRSDPLPAQAARAITGALGTVASRGG